MTTETKDATFGWLDAKVYSAEKGFDVYIGTVFQMRLFRRQETFNGRRH